MCFPPNSFKHLMNTMIYIYLFIYFDWYRQFIKMEETEITITPSYTGSVVRVNVLAKKQIVSTSYPSPLTQFYKIYN